MNQPKHHEFKHKKSRDLTFQSRAKLTYVSDHSGLFRIPVMMEPTGNMAIQRLSLQTPSSCLFRQPSTPLRQQNIRPLPVGFDRFVSNHIRQRCQTTLQSGSKLGKKYRVKSVNTQGSVQLCGGLVQKMKGVIRGSKKHIKRVNEGFVNMGLDIRSIRHLNFKNEDKHKQKKQNNILKQQCKDEQDTKQKHQMLTIPFGRHQQLGIITKKHILHKHRLRRRRKSRQQQLKKSRFQQKKQIVQKKPKMGESSVLMLKSKASNGSRIRLSAQWGQSKEMQQYRIKIYRMFLCLDILMNAFHIRIKTPVVQKQTGVQSNKQRNMKKYSYFVGPGNNGNLIRSILRKRTWWKQTDSAQKANFVWTQLKMTNLLQKMPQHKSNWSNEVILYQQQDLDQQQNLQAEYEIRQIQQIRNQSWDKIFHKRHDHRYRRQLHGLQSQLRLQLTQVPQQLHNHFQCNFMFGNKNALFHNLTSYCAYTSQDITRLLPQTFHIQKAVPSTSTSFQAIFNDRKKKGGIWIVKPAQNTNRGYGISCTTSLNEIKLKLNEYGRIIVQSYIRNLLLYNGRKFDIRAYMLAINMKGRLKFYWYDQGYIRTSSQLFDINNLSDRMVHLTNDAVQKHGQNYSKYQPGNKLSYQQLQKYLQGKFPKDKIDISVLHAKMGAMAAQTVKATYCRLQPKRKQFGFQLFGLDFIIDSQLKPYLIQINTNPCLQLSSPVLQRLIPCMIQNMFRLALDPLFRPDLSYSFSRNQAYFIYDVSFLNRNRFGLIFDEKFDSDFGWEERCGTSIEWGEGQQQEYTDQGDIICVQY